MTNNRLETIVESSFLLPSAWIVFSRRSVENVIFPAVTAPIEDLLHTIPHLFGKHLTMNFILQTLLISMSICVILYKRTMFPERIL